LNDIPHLGNVLGGAACRGKDGLVLCFPPQPGARPVHGHKRLCQLAGAQPRKCVALRAHNRLVVLRAAARGEPRQPLLQLKLESGEGRQPLRVFTREWTLAGASGIMPVTKDALEQQLTLSASMWCRRLPASMTARMAALTTPGFFQAANANVPPGHETGKSLAYRINTSGRATDVQMRLAWSMSLSENGRSTNNGRAATGPGGGDGGNGIRGDGGRDGRADGGRGDEGRDGGADGGLESKPASTAAKMARV